MKISEEDLLRGQTITNILDFWKTYSKKALKAKRFYLFLKILIAVSSILIPVVINCPFSSINQLQFVITILGLIVALSVAIEEIFKFREKWASYNNISIFIDHEYSQYLNRVGDYKNLNDNKSQELFIENIETKRKDMETYLLETSSRPKEG